MSRQSITISLIGLSVSATLLAAAPSASASTAIGSVDLATRPGNGIVTKVGADLYQLPSYPSSINPPEVTFDWTAHGTSGDVTSSGCTVVADITGPGDYNQRRRSGDCSGSPSSALAIMTPGAYTVTIAVTSPDGAGPVNATKTFNVIPKGA